MGRMPRRGVDGSEEGEVDGGSWRGPAEGAGGEDRRRGPGLGQEQREGSGLAIRDQEDLTGREEKRKGSDLMIGPLEVAATYSPTLRCSTIGVVGLNFSVRNGKRWNPKTITT